MLSGKAPSPPHARAKGPLPDGQRGVDPCEHIQNSPHDTVKGAWTGPSEGSHEYTQIKCEKRIFEIGELERGVLDLQPSTRSPEQRLILCPSESHPRSSGVEEQEQEQEGVSNGNLSRASTDTPRNAWPGDVLRGPEAEEEMGSPGPRQPPPSSQPVTPSALPLHLIPLLPQKSPSSKRQRRSIGLSSNEADKVADDFGLLNNPTGGTSPSPQSLRLRPQILSAEPTGISRTLAYAMDQMNATHSSEYLPLRGGELEETVITKEAEVVREGDAATRPKIVRFEESVWQPAELAERLWTKAVQAVAATARTHGGAEQQTESAIQSGEQGEGPTCAQDATVGGENMADEGQNMGATWEMDAKAWCATEGGSQTVDLDAGSEAPAERATVASQALKPAQLQEYTRLKERETELRNAGAECRILEERLEAREKDLRNRLETVRQSLEAVRQRRASINRQGEMLQQKLEAVAKADALGADGLPQSS